MRTNCIDYGLAFNSLTKRATTDIIVIHHTGNPYDDDLSVEQIHESHLGLGWAGIGYHFVVRKDGSVELGRPHEYIGSHAYGENSHSIGIHLSGNFEIVEPTAMQIESLSRLVADLAELYNIPVCGTTILGHRDLIATACPGKNLYEIIIDTIVGKAIWYQQNT